MTKVHHSYAFTGEETIKRKYNENQELYEDLKDKAELTLVKTTYAAKHYRVDSNPHDLTDAELALIADGGNLCFGFRRNGDKIIIHTD